MSNHQPMVSVIIPTYNDGGTICRAIDSTLNQTIDELEVVVVDDASTDDTQHILKRYESTDRVSIIRHEVNRGGSAARNTGIEQARGEYIAFLDADDEFHPDKLAFQCAYLRTHPDIGAVFCDIDYRRRGSFQRVRAIAKAAFQPSASREFPVGSEGIPEILSMEWDTYGASTLLARAELVDRLGGFDERFERHQDWEFLVRLLAESSLGYIDQALVVKYDTPSPGADTVKRAKLRYINTFAGYIDKYENKGYAIYETHQFDLARRYLIEGEFRKAWWLCQNVSLTTWQIVVLCYSAISGLKQIVLSETDTG
jgi:glycosyltransferase involved in cell wall biosynthesis